MDSKIYTLDLGGKSLQVEFNSLAEQANGSVFVQMGGTVVMVNAVMAKKEREGVDFFPLTVDYEEKYYAAGKIGGSRFIRREARPSDEAILTARLIDRSMRPLFPSSLRRDIQIIATVLSWDGENDADILAILGASLAITTSDIPWNGPIGAIRLGFDAKKDLWIVNPTYQEREELLGDIVLSGCEHSKEGVVINMIEAKFAQASEDIVARGAEYAFSLMTQLIEFQKEIAAKEGKEKTVIPQAEKDSDLTNKIHSLVDKKLEEILFPSGDKKQKNRKNHGEKMEQMNVLKREVQEQILESTGDESKMKFVGDLFEKILDEMIHAHAIEKEKRVDGRKLEEVRAIEAKTHLLPRTHGSAVFIRGTTKALAIVTLGAPGDQQLLDGMEVAGKKRFMHHYNFPPYSCGETKPMRGPSRRDIGHGMLVEKALEPLLPEHDDFPYTMRVVTEILSSNGSTSMASVSAASLALIDAGVPMKNIATGISIGLMSKEDGTYKLLTDIQGPEDHHGDMDFKVAGTKEGICAIQMDVKITGITLAIFKEALTRAKEVRLAIIEEMEKAVPDPKPSLSPYAPRITTIQINPSKIGEVIGPGGKMINKIIEETGTTIDIEDDGKIFISSPSADNLDRAVQWIKEITHEVSAGEVYEGVVKRIMDFGAFVEILPGQEGLIHISRLAPHRVEKTTDVVQVGDSVTVKVVEIDGQGRINLTIQDKQTGQFIEKDLAPRTGSPRGFKGRRP